MFSWLFGSVPERVTVQIIPDNSARTLPGFREGGLTLIAEKGTTFQKLMDKFNTYRGPDNQIHNLFTLDGDSIPFSTVITQPVICVLKKV